MLRLLIKWYVIFLCTTFSQTRGGRDTVLPCFEMVDGTLWKLSESCSMSKVHLFSDHLFSSST